MQSTERIRVALIGCGQIADAHLQEIRKIECAELVGVCDVHQDLADQAAARFGVPRTFNNHAHLIAETSPDVVHITTPAHTHCPLTIELLKAGVHVYVEKPFTIDAGEAELVLRVADETGRRVCLGHDQLFDPAWLRCREMVAQGAVGDVTHVESVLGYPLSGQFGRQVTSDPQHWVRRLPGGLFQNTISHPLYRITEFLTDEHPVLDTDWYAGTPGVSFPTELFAHIRGENVTGSLMFSTRIAAQRITRIYGTRSALEVDLDGQVVRRIGKGRMPGAFEKLETPWRQLREAAGNVCRNVMRFLKSDIHYFAGMRSLFEQFYRSILDGTQPPISQAEMLRVTRIMDELFAQCRNRQTKPRIRVTTGRVSGVTSMSATKTVPDVIKNESHPWQEVRS